MRNERLIVTVCILVVGSFLLASQEVRADFTFGSGADQFTITTVTVGNAGNSADIQTTYGIGTRTPGSVSYDYEVMKYEVTRGMVFKFNNLNDASSGSRDITLDFGYDEATQEAASINPDRFNSYGDPASGYKDTLPASGISALEAAQFVNWLNVDAGYSRAYNLDTNSDSSDWTTWSIAEWGSGESGYLASQPYRNSEARFFLMNFDEAYKAAFYDGSSGNYFDYATSSDTRPISYGYIDYGLGAQVWQGTHANVVAVNGSQKAVTEVDQAGGVSPYGVMAMTGNKSEILEFSSTFTAASFGGSTDAGGESGLNNGYAHHSTLVRDYNLSDEFASAGFRVLYSDLTSGSSSGGSSSPTVPEPSTAMALGLLGIVGFANHRRRRRVRSIKHLALP